MKPYPNGQTFIRNLKPKSGRMSGNIGKWCRMSFLTSLKAMEAIETCFEDVFELVIVVDDCSIPCTTAAVYVISCSGALESCQTSPSFARSSQTFVLAAAGLQPVTTTSASYFVLLNSCWWPRWQYQLPPRLVLLFSDGFGMVLVLSRSFGTKLRRSPVSLAPDYHLVSRKLDHDRRQRSWCFRKSVSIGT